MIKVNSREDVEEVFRMKNAVNALSSQLIEARRREDRAKVTRLTIRINRIKREMRERFDIIV